VCTIIPECIIAYKGALKLDLTASAVRICKKNFEATKENRQKAIGIRIKQRDQDQKQR
jgi:hypothetical protein